MLVLGVVGTVVLAYPLCRRQNLGATVVGDVVPVGREFDD